MTIEFDDKGKFFTDVVTKVAIPAIIQTATLCIHGNVHARPDQRVKDVLDVDEKFLAVTNATVYSPEGQVLYHAKFISIQRSQIIWIIPESEIIGATDEAGEH